MKIDINKELISILTDVSELKSINKIINKFIYSLKSLYPDLEIIFKKNTKAGKNDISILKGKKIYGYFLINNDFIKKHRQAYTAIKKSVKLFSILIQKNNSKTKTNIKKESENELENKLKFQKHISYISEKLLNLNTKNSENILNDILSKIVNMINFERGAILTIDSTQNFRRKAFYDKINSEKPAENINTILLWIKNKILNGTLINYPDINNMTSDAEQTKKFFIKKGFKSFYAFPLKIKSKIIGALILISIQKLKNIDTKKISQLKIINKVLANAILRNKIESELVKSEQNYYNFIKNFQGIAFKGKLNFEPIFYHGKIKEITGYNLKDFQTGKIKWKDLIKKDDFIKLNNTFMDINKIPDHSVEREYRIQRKNGEIRWVNEMIQNICDEHGIPSYVQGVIYDITEKKKAIEDLLTEKNKAQEYLNIADVMLIAINEKGTVTLLNKKGEEILGYKKNELIGKNWFDTCLPIQLRKPVKSVFNKLIEGIVESVEYYENPILNKNGEERLIAWHNTIIKNEKGKIIGTLSSGEDITEKKMQELQLKETNLKLEMALESGRTDSWEINLPNRTITYTDRWAEYMGYKPGEIPYTQDAVRSIIHEDDLEKTNIDLKDHLEGKTPIYETECRIRKKNGEYIWISSRGKIVERDQDNNPVRLIGTNFDITQLKNIENKLRESEERYRMLIENANEAITLFDTNGKIILLNSIAAKLLGGKPEDLIEKKYLDILPDLLISQYENTISEILMTKKGNVSENTLTFNNQMYWFITSTQPIINKEGNITHFLTISLDITQRKIDEQEKEELMHKLKSKNEELKTILYVTTHDLRTPLVNIQGFSKELILCCNQIKNIILKLDDKTKNELIPIIDEELPTDLKFITTNVEKMDKLLKGLLMLSRISTKKANYKKINTNNLFTKIIDSIQYQLKEKNADIKIEKLPECIGEEDQLNQAFTNILINSIKYSDNNRQLKIKISGIKKEQNSIYCIEDNGIGINPNHKDKIFIIFHRLDPTGQISGEGLGLTIVKRIIEQHKGKVWIESELNKGCKFYIQIPNKIKL